MVSWSANRRSARTPPVSLYGHQQIMICVNRTEDIQQLSGTSGTSGPSHLIICTGCQIRSQRSSGNRGNSPRSNPFCGERVAASISTATPGRTARSRGAQFRRLLAAQYPTDFYFRGFSATERAMTRCPLRSFDRAVCGFRLESADVRRRRRQSGHLKCGHCLPAGFIYCARSFADVKIGDNDVA
jgi:phage terminase large subunit-like protein